ncbi:MAG TPA: hypothetical protein VNU19_21025 [Candidatus Acidoferrum sp.]|jgi:hypothetical protein|nr:hypothetical protein [Candidatus Acidoferrum sp.]
MTAPRAEQIVAGYLARLEAALAPVPETRRVELLEEVREHIAEARAALPDETDADLLNILDRLGDPADVAAAEIGRADPAPAPARRASRGLEIAALILLLLFWPVGVVLLWMSDAWTTRDKLIGTLAPPGGYLGIFILGPALALGTFTTACRTISDDTGRVISSTCPSGLAQTGIDVGTGLLVVIYLIGPILSAAYLAVRLRHGPESSGTTHGESIPPGVPAVTAE